ncbi:hypothetical protein ACJJI4_23910 (plasmid) [Microbulbifer sp. TRSA002]|uniref:hypothetical protein n=1 Tax=Microbulbifer sp. TRSA002 TaxID=3243382 RepID=UPI0040397574
MMIEATIIVRTAHLEKVAALFTSIAVEVNSQASSDYEGTSKILVSGKVCLGDLHLEVVLDNLRQHGISYSYYWREPKCKYGGESHYRSNGKYDQHLSWMDHEKNMVNIEDVRQAVAQGEIAVLELLETMESRFTPLDWQEVAA